jgi:preprotein translocase subunit YajC
VGSGFFIVLIVMFGFMYLMLIRPQRQQQRRHAEMLKRIGPGDEVITAGGIYGDVIEVEPDRVTLEIAEDVHIEVARSAIASIVPQEDAESFEDELEATTVEEPEPVVEERTEQEEARR